MAPQVLKGHFLLVFSSLQFFTQTWCETWAHVFKKSPSVEQLGRLAGDFLFVLTYLWLLWTGVFVFCLCYILDVFTYFFI